MTEYSVGILLFCEANCFQVVAHLKPVSLWASVFCLNSLKSQLIKRNILKEKLIMYEVCIQSMHYTAFADV